MTVWSHLPTIFKQRHALRIAGIVGVCVAIITTLFLSNVSHAATGTNSTINFQGRLLNSSGGVVPDGYYNMQFKIYQDGDGQAAGDTGGTGGSLKWTETYVDNNGTSGVQVKNGYFSVTLGSLNPFGTSIDWNQDTLWLSMNVAGSDSSCTTFGTSPCSADGEMLPMKRLTATPYAMNSAKLQGKTAADFIQNQNTAAQTGTSLWIQGTARADSGLLANSIDSATAGDLSIGAAAATSITLGSSSSNITTNINGALVVKPIGTDSTSLFQVKNANNDTILKVDSTNGQVTITGQNAYHSNLVIKAAPNQPAYQMLEFQGSDGSATGNIGADINGNLGFGLSMLGAVTTGSGNIGMGAYSLAATSTGSHNIALGNGSLATNTSGDDNVALGNQTLTNNTTGYSNIGMGSGVLSANSTGTYNIGIGDSALQGTTTGYSNVAMGAYAGYKNTTGYKNTFIGVSAGNCYWTATFCTANSITNSTAIGANAQVQASNSIVLGSVEEASNLGLGTTIPLNLLSVSPANATFSGVGTASQSGTAVTGSGTSWDSSIVGSEFIFSDANDNHYGTITAVADATHLTLSTSATVSSQAFRIHRAGFQVTNTGKVGIGTLNPQYDLDVSGTAHVTTLMTNAVTSESGQTLSLDGNQGVSVKVNGTSITTFTSTNVQIGSGSGTGQPILLTLDKASSTPTATGSSLIGSMYYDTSKNAIQCYTANGWGACASSPDTFVTLSPEYAGAVLQGSGDGSMTAGLCSDELNINDGSSGQATVCGTSETYNYYKWVSTNASSSQTYNIFVNYQLPSTFTSFVAGSTSLKGRTDSANSAVSYTVYRKNSSSGLTACGSSVSVSTGTQSSWQTGTASGSSDPSTCGFTAGDSILVKITMSSMSSANAYASTLNFTYSNH